MQRAHDWLSQARADLAAARTSHEGGRYEWSCFQAQQCGEKALRGLALASNTDLREHSLLHLCRELERLDLKPPGEVWGDAVELDRHYIPTRYPNGFASGFPAEYYDEKLSEEPVRVIENQIQHSSHIHENITISCQEGIKSASKIKNLDFSDTL